MDETLKNFEKYKYTSQEFDGGTGLYYMNARYYDPEIGRFITADTMVPNPANTQHFNRYMYGDGNPVGFNDPTGHESESFWDWICNSISNAWNSIFGGEIVEYLPAGVKIDTSNTLSYEEAMKFKDDAYMTEYILTEHLEFDGENIILANNFGITIDRWEANSGIPGVYDPLPNGHYRGDNLRAPYPASENAMTRDGVGFALELTPQFVPDPYRDNLRIHPDGNVPGTEGCIGLTGYGIDLLRFYLPVESYLMSHRYIDVYVNIP